MNFLKRFWKAIGAVGGLIGLYYAPLDMQGWREAATPWRYLVTMIERETLATMLATGCLLYILWMDVRPIIRERFKKVFIQAIQVEAYSQKLEFEGEDYWENQFFLLIVNARKDAQTLLDVRAKLFPLFSDSRAFFSDGSTQISLHGGEAARVYLGSSVTKEMVARPRTEGVLHLQPDWIKMLIASDIDHGHKMLSVGRVTYSPVIAEKPYANPDNRFAVQVLADGMPPHTFHCGIGVRDGEADVFLIDPKAADIQPRKQLSKIEKTLR